MLNEKNLRNAAREINEVMDGLEPPINVDAKVTKLVSEIREAIEFINPETDVFSEPTQDIIDELRPKVGDKKKESEPEEDGKSVAEKLHEKNIASKPPRVGKKKEEPEPEEEEDEEEEKPAPKASKKKEKGEENKNTRVKAMAEVLKKEPHLGEKEAVIKADKLYVQWGGKANPQESASQFRKVVQVFEVLGLR